MGIKDIPTMEEVEEAAIRRALAETDTLQEAADALGIGRRTLYRKREQYGIQDANLGFGGPPAGEGGGLLGDVLDE